MKQGFLVIAHNIRSCYNVGSIFRSADALGVEKIYLTGYTPRPGVLVTSDAESGLDKLSFKVNSHSDSNLSLGERRGPKTSFTEALKAKKDAKKIAKTALGAEEVVAWEYQRQLGPLIQKLQSQGVQVVALEQASNSLKLTDFKPNFPLALLVGNEVRGISPQILKKVDKIVEIPMQGKKESLNVGVAFGIAGFWLQAVDFGKFRC